MNGLRKVKVTAELVTELLTDRALLARRGPLEVVDGLPPGAVFVYAEVERPINIPHGTEGGTLLVLLFQHESWDDTPDGDIPSITPTLREAQE